MKFYFIRHGETDWNSRNLVTGQQDVDLNEIGISQVKYAAEILSNKKIDKIVTSTLKRCMTTSNILAETLKLKILLEPSLKERGYGNIEGKNVIAINMNNKTIETDLQFITRFSDAIFKHLESDESILFVSHGDVFSELTNYLCGRHYSADNAVPYVFSEPSREDFPWIVDVVEKD